MEINQLYALASIVLPREVLDYFEIVKIKRNSTEIHIHLDEKMDRNLVDDVHF